MEEIFECSFCNYLYGIIGKLKKLLDQIVKEEGLTRNQGIVLFCIHKNKKITINEICKELDTNQGNTSSVCKFLENQKLVKKIKDVKDERAVYMMLTKKGEEKIESINKKIGKLEKYFDSFSNVQIQTMLDSLGNIDNLLDNILNT